MQQCVGLALKFTNKAMAACNLFVGKLVTIFSPVLVGPLALQWSPPGKTKADDWRFWFRITLVDPGSLACYKSAA